MARPDLSQSANLFDFFHGHVGAAARDKGTTMSDDSVFYLANLLVERTKAPLQDDRVDTLAELHIQASSSGRVEAIRTYRELGDKALVTAGFFRRSLNRGAVGVDYYLAMGAGAYDALARILEGPRRMIVGGVRGLEAIFQELSRCFSVCADVLREARDGILAEGNPSSDSDVLRLYEEWLATGSPRVAARLGELGVVPARAMAGRKLSC